MNILMIAVFFILFILVSYLACLPPEVSEPNKEGADYGSGEDLYNFSPFKKDPIDEANEILRNESKI